MDVEADYVILGAGLAGTVLQRLLGPERCVLLDPNPGAYKVGESVAPEQFHHPLLRSLAAEAARLPSYAPKRGSTFVGFRSAAAFPLPHDASEVSMHVARAELEALMHARFGTSIVRERVVDVDVESRRVKTRQRRYRARKLVLDCSGSAMITARALGAVEERGPIHARWAYFDLIDVDDARFAEELARTGMTFRAYDPVASRVVASENAERWECSKSTVLTRLGPGLWTWQIPLFRRRLLSFGVVSKRGKITDAELRSLALETHSPVYRLRERRRGPSPYDRSHSRSRFARVASVVASAHHAAVGDAAGFTDPVYSVGTAAAVNRAIELATLLASGWDDTTARKYAHRTEALRRRADQAFAAWYDGTHLDDDTAAEIRDGFLVGTAFQVGINAHYKTQLLDASPAEGLGSPQDGCRVPLSGGTALSPGIRALLDLPVDGSLGAWTFVGAAPFRRGVQLRWTTASKPPLLLNVQFGPVARYYRRAGPQIALSYMNPMDGPYPFGDDVAWLIDVVAERIDARPDDWLRFDDDRR